MLYRLWETPPGDTIIKQLVLPKALRAEVLQQLHDAQQLDTWELPRPWAVSGRDSTGSSAGVTSKSGVGTVTYVLRREDHTGKLKLH